jgi:polyhydroxyalkanoate synthase
MPRTVTEEAAMEDVVGKGVPNTLGYNDAVAQEILENLMNQRAVARRPADRESPVKKASSRSGKRSPGAQPQVGIDDGTDIDYGNFAQDAQRAMESMFQRQATALDSINEFWLEQFRVLTGTSDIAAAKDDHRFDDPEWRENAHYKLAMQSHLLLRKGLAEWVDALPVEHAQAERIRFMLSLFTEAIAPSNWPSNPAAVKRCIETGGASALKGLQHMVEDIVRNRGMPSTVNRDKLEVGRDMATTPGKVVYRSEVFELIQYAPSTKEVHARPFLMVPPQINRFYFYDLSEKKSLIRYAVDAGLQTFCISWRNPSQQHRDWNFDTYLAAIEEAVDVVRDITGSPDVNIEGGCVAGMEVAALLADLAERGERKINSATLMVTQLDTSVETQLGVLATPEALELAKAVSRMEGLMPGSQMGLMFSLLRPNDLVWNYWVNNYLLGNDPPIFDVLAWNADTTRMTAGFHVDLLDLVQHNPLVRGEFKVRGRPVHLDKIACDQFWLSGLADHITPWRACYASSRLLGGNREFVVSDGGHIQSMISSPNNPKAKYLANAAQPATAEAWLEGATEHSGSWWLRWRDWIKRRSGKLQKARRTFGDRSHRPLADAPGTYVFE